MFYVATLNLSFCSLVTDVGLSRLAGRCSILQTLNLNECSQVTDIGLIRLGEGCSMFQTLDLSGCRVTDAGLIRLR